MSEIDRTFCLFFTFWAKNVTMSPKNIQDLNNELVF